jgi:hypothetical protein
MSMYFSDEKLKRSAARYDLVFFFLFESASIAHVSFHFQAERTVFSPRTLIFDLKGSLGAMGSGGYKTKKLHSGPAPGWFVEHSI